LQILNEKHRIVTKNKIALINLHSFGKIWKQFTLVFWNKIGLNFLCAQLACLRANQSMFSAIEATYKLQSSK
jgi:hypothetical protein